MIDSRKKIQDLIDELDSVAGQAWAGLGRGPLPRWMQGEEDAIKEARARAVERFAARSRRQARIRAVQVRISANFKPLARKAMALFLVVALNWFGLHSVLNTEAFFSDSENTGVNFFATGVLDMEADSSDEFSPAVDPQTESRLDATVRNSGGIEIYHNIETDNFTGDNAFCGKLKAKVKAGGNEVYDGSLSGLNVGAIQLATGSVENLEFIVSLLDDDPALQSKTCDFDIVLTAWQTNLAGPEEGFSDTGVLEAAVESGQWGGPDVVINEVLPNPEGDDDQGGTDGEWVELYNRGNQGTDLAGWYIEDAASNTQEIIPANTFNNRTYIGAPGSYLEWVVVFMDWSMLNNGGDVVYLFDNEGNRVDRRSFDASDNDDDENSNNTPGQDNDSDSGDETAGNEGKSYALIPDGWGEWIDPVPTPGAPNELEADDAEEPAPHRLQYEGGEANEEETGTDGQEEEDGDGSQETKVDDGANNGTQEEQGENETKESEEEKEDNKEQEGSGPAKEGSITDGKQDETDSEDKEVEKEADEPEQEDEPEENEEKTGEGGSDIQEDDDGISNDSDDNVSGAEETDESEEDDSKAEKVNGSGESDRENERETADGEESKKEESDDDESGQTTKEEPEATEESNETSIDADNDKEPEDGEVSDTQTEEPKEEDSDDGGDEK
jgi:hypothetical protein